jgi:hypothetical protein
LALDGSTAKYHRQVAERFKREIDAAMALDPEDIQSLRDLMEFYLQAPGIAGGNKVEALAVAERIGRIHRIGRIDRAQGLSAEAQLAEFDKDTVKAEALLLKAVEAAPGKYKARVELAQFELTKEHRNLEAAEAEAREALQREALQMDATRVDAYSALADVYASRGQWAPLDGLLAEADAAVPDDSTPHYRAAEAMLRTGRNPAAALRNLRNYPTQEPEGNQPSAAQAREKLELAGAVSTRSQ